VSALINFLIFARPILFKKLGTAGAALSAVKARCAVALPRHFNRSEFIPAQIGSINEFGEPIVRKLGSGSSASLSPWITADGFALVDAGVGSIEAGERLDFYPFRNAFSIS